MGDFIGVYYSKINSGRLYIPKQLFSKIEDKKLIIKCGYDGYLKIFQLSKWKNILDQLHKFDPFNLNVDSFIRMYTYRAFEVDISPRQTILIPSFFREWAKIDKEVVLMGALDSIDIINTLPLILDTSKLSQKPSVNTNKLVSLNFSATTSIAGCSIVPPKPLIGIDSNCFLFLIF